MSAVDEALSGAKDDTEANPTWKDQFVTLDSSGQASFALLSECDYVRRDVVEAALKHLAERLERAEARIAALRGVAGRHVCDYVSQWGVSDDGCACVVCQVHDALVWDVAKEAKP